MREMQGSFPRIKDRLDFEMTGERKFVIMSMVLLYNYRASKVGMNQIRTTYLPRLDVDANDYISNFMHNM